MDTRLPERIRAKIVLSPEGCWLWTAYALRGYGIVHWKGKNWRAHRVIYTLLVGPIPPGLDLDHLCRNPPCVNPAHLEPVTRGENIRRGDTGQHHARKTHCPQGHPYDEENTQRPPSGGRYCRECRRVRRRAYKAQRRAVARATLAS